MTTAVLQGRYLYNGAIGEAVEIVFREGDRPPASPPAFALAMSRQYLGACLLASDPKAVPDAPIERCRDCRRL